MTVYQNLETLTYTPTMTVTDEQLDKTYDKAETLIYDNYLEVFKDAIDEDFFTIIPISMLAIFVALLPTGIISALLNLTPIFVTLVFFGFLATPILFPLALIRIGKNMNRKIQTIRHERSEELAQWLQKQGITVGNHFYQDTEEFTDHIVFTDDQNIHYTMTTTRAGTYQLNTATRNINTAQTIPWFNLNNKTVTAVERVQQKIKQLKTAKLTPENQHAVNRANTDLQELMQLHKELGKNRTKQHKQEFNQLLTQLETELDEVAATAQKTVEKRLEAHKQYILGRKKKLQL